MKKRITTILIIVLFAAGLGVFLYPTISNWLASRNQTQAIQNYKTSVEQLDVKKAQEELLKAQKYNAGLNGSVLYDPFSVKKADEADQYEKLLNVNGVMGYLTIPKINVNLPIYHGTSEQVLDKGVGHLKGSSLPVGGENTHAVLTGHRGLPSARLFTDLDKLAKSDLFYVHILGEVLTYQVDQIKVVEPYNTQDLKVSAGKDYVTLLTCTPYGINSHRMLVRGVRVPTKAQETMKVQDVQNHTNRFDWIFWLIPAIVLPALTVIIFIKRHRRKPKE